MTAPTEDGIHAGVDEGTYHSDKASLSSTGARKLLESPRKFQWSLTQPAQTAKHFDIGHMVHSIVLGVGSPIAIIDFDDYRTKAAKDERDEAYATGKVPMLRDDAVTCQEMAFAILNHPIARALFEAGDPEQSLYWHDGEIRLRARTDWLRTFTNADPLIGDVKTTALSANPKGWGATAAKYKLHFQACWYERAVVACGLGERADFAFLNVEKDPPYLVSVTELDTDALELGAREVQRAIDAYTECTATNTWPNWLGVDDNQIHTVGLPRWMYREEQTA